MAKKHKPLVFISHLSTEREVAIAFKTQIERCFLGMIDVFVSSDDQTMPLGSRWLDRISDALRSCVVEVVICSPASITRQWINFEAGAGWVRGIPVIPLCHSGLSPSELPLPLNMLQAVRATDPNGLARILKVFAEILGSAVPYADFSEFIAKVAAIENKNSHTVFVYDRSADLQADLPDLIKKCKREIVLCGVHFNISLSDRRPDYLEAMERGVNITIAVLNPDSITLSNTADAYSMDFDELSGECRAGISKLKALRMDYDQMKLRAPDCGTLDILIFARLPRARFYLFDSATPHGIVNCTPYIDGIRSSQSPSYCFPCEHPSAVRYQKACRDLLAHAAPLEFR